MNAVLAGDDIELQYIGDGTLEMSEYGILDENSPSEPRNFERQLLVQRAQEQALLQSQDQHLEKEHQLLKEREREERERQERERIIQEEEERLRNEEAERERISREEETMKRLAQQVLNTC